MRATTTPVRAAAVVVLLAGPTALAFFQGGFFDRPRLWAAIGAWALALLAALVSPSPLPRRLPGRLALAGLGLLTAWTALSLTWAPLRGAAVDDLQRLVLYTGGLVAAAALLRGRGALRSVEPALAAGTFAVVAYGLSERLLPGVFDLARSVSADGRLDQPLTYWNAMGALAGMGLVLCARLTAEDRRPRAVGALAAAVAPVLGLGLFLSLSRGAIAAAAAGLFVLVVVSPTSRQVRAVVLCAAAAGAVVVVALALDSVRTLEGPASTRESQGLVMLVALILAGGASAWLRGRVTSGPDRELEQVRRHAGAALAVAVVVALVAAIAGATLSSGERKVATAPPRGSNSPQRLGSVDSSRYSYWKVAAGAFADHPLEGLGSGGFRARWLLKRTSLDPAKDAHSLYLETPAELGLAGMAALAVFLFGVGAATRRALERNPRLAAGPAAALTVWAIHAGIDWDWEMPALTLIAIALAGALIALGDD